MRAGFRFLRGVNAAIGGAGTISRDVDETTCTRCHTPDWSADWSYDEYLKTGVHNK